MADSEKEYKEGEHRRERRAVKVAVRQGDETPDPKEFGDPWKGPKDGKQYWNHPRAYRK